MLKTAIRAGLPIARRFRQNTGALKSLVSLQHSPRLSGTESRSSISVSLASSSVHRRAMSAHAGESTLRPDPDKVLRDIADYVHSFKIDSDLALETARLCLIDTIGCGLEALRFPDCTKLLGPVVEGTIVPNGTPHCGLLFNASIHIPIIGTRVPGTNYQLDPIRGAFNIGAIIRWLDFNDCFLAAECKVHCFPTLYLLLTAFLSLGGHPSDNLGAILAVADHLCRQGQAITVRDVLEAMIKAHEIQGSLALLNSFNRVGLDHVLLVKVASTAVVSKLLGLNRDQTIDAISQAWVDGQSLRTYRHAPNTGPRKSWAAGDACSRAVNLALLVKKGEKGLPSVLTAKTWGFYDVLFKVWFPFYSMPARNIIFGCTGKTFRIPNTLFLIHHGECALQDILPR